VGFPNLWTLHNNLFTLSSVVFTYIERGSYPSLCELHTPNITVLQYSQSWSHTINLHFLSFQLSRTIKSSNPAFGSSFRVRDSLTTTALGGCYILTDYNHSLITHNGFNPHYSRRMLDCSWLLTPSPSPSHIATDGQPVSKSWYRAPSWDPWPDIYCSSTVTVLFLLGALSDERMGLSFIYAAGLCQCSVSRVLVPWDLRPYFTVSHLRLPFSSPPTTRSVTVEVFDPASTRGISLVVV
jgi:hypothetical protein